MKNTKDLYSQLVQAFDLSTIDQQETPQLYQAESNASSEARRCSKQDRLS